MTLAASRIVFQGETPHAHERDGLDAVIQALPNTDPYHVWALVDLLDPSTGRLYEIDALVLGYSALYLLELKGGPGRYEGDFQDWYRTPPGEPARYMDPPLRLANHKAKILKSRLAAKMHRSEDCPRVEPLIFLSHPDVELAFRNHGDLSVVTRKTLARALTHHEFPGRPDGWRADPISRPAAQDVVRAMQALGLRPRKSAAYVGGYELGVVLDEGPGFQDRLATHRDRKAFVQRARTYLVPQQTSVERRQQLRRAADRESQLLWDVREHPSVLRITDYVTDAPLGPTVLFDSFDAGIQLDAFIRQHPNLDFSERVELVEQIARALAFCHRKQVIHGALSPQAVLVRRHPETGKIETRLYNFQLGTSAHVDATLHWSAFAPEPWAVYQAPELREDPTAGSPASDVFSLGALAYFVFTGLAPAPSLSEMDRLLRDQRSLDPRLVDDGFDANLADLIEMATCVTPLERVDDAEVWIDDLLDRITRPTEPETSPEIDPLSATSGDRLAGELRVERTLGHGATSRVLEVERDSDGRSYALKVSSGADQDARIRDEGGVLRGLRHARIVQLVQDYELGGRPALLLTLAGAETLHRFLLREGTVSLERALTYGEDLLSALEYLEEQQVLHRDIKPANLGVGTAGKEAAHLTLFDFSLSRAPATELALGTSAYRDPFLGERRKADFAAERWSAAVTLHEMVTGVRPSFGGPGGTALDAQAPLVLAAERFDAAARAELVAFFTKALARDVAERFSSTADMRHAWAAALDVDHRPARRPPSDHPEVSARPEPDRGRPEDAEIAAIAPEALVETLPLSLRARNALDRAGVIHAKDLRLLADNRLSAIRGIGSRVASEILEFRNRWRDLRSESTDTEAKAFFAGYAAEDLLTAAAGLSPEVAGALADAGLRTLAALASAPEPHVVAIAERHGFDPSTLRSVLDRENKNANEREHPTTLEGWIQALLRPIKRNEHIRALYGLEPPFAGRLDVTVRELAEAKELTPAAIYIALSKCRAIWEKHGALEGLRERCRAVLEAGGGALVIARAAEELLALLPHDRSTPRDSLLAQGAALFHVIAEVEKDSHRLQFLRLDDRAPWVCLSDDHARAVRALGDAADELASLPTVASVGEVRRAIVDAANGTPFATLAEDRLIDLAAAASKTAARSSRLEIYPRQMPAERALDLSMTLLTGALTPDEVRRRVELRYADAAKLPDRPALDELLLRHGLRFNEATQRYVRTGSPEETDPHTRVSSVARAHTALPAQVRSMDPAAIAAREFDERLRSAVERRSLRVLGVTAERAPDAARRLGERLGVTPVCFDALLATAIRRQMAQGGVKRDEVIHAADREGPNGASWGRLVKLVEAACRETEAELLPPKKPLLLVQLGLVARYSLTSFLTKLAETSKLPDAEAIFVLVPSHDTGGMPRINGQLAFPGLLASQALWVSREWLANWHNAAA